MNQVNIIGRLTRDVETKQLSTGTSVASFSVAVSKKWKDKNGEKKEKVSFFDVKAWGTLGNIISQYFHKGSMIALGGELEQETWEKDGSKQSRIIINLKDFDFIDAFKKDDKPEVSDSSNDNGAFNDEDVPF